MNLTGPDYLDYLEKLETVAGVKIDSFDSLICALKIRMDFFEANGCRISDHSLDYVMYQPATEEEVEAIFAKRLAGENITGQEKKQFETAFMLRMGREYHKKDWVMQLHYGVKRDVNIRIYDKLGINVGTDCISNYAPAAEMED